MFILLLYISFKFNKEKLKREVEDLRKSEKQSFAFGQRK